MSLKIFNEKNILYIYRLFCSNLELRVVWFLVWGKFLDIRVVVMCLLVIFFGLGDGLLLSSIF